MLTVLVHIHVYHVFWMLSTREHFQFACYGCSCRCAWVGTVIDSLDLYAWMCLVDISVWMLEAWCVWCVHDLCNSQSQCESGELLKRQWPNLWQHWNYLAENVLVLASVAVSTTVWVWSPYLSRWCWQHSYSFYVASNLLLFFICSGREGGGDTYTHVCVCTSLKLISIVVHCYSRQ